MYKKTIGIILIIIAGLFSLLSLGSLFTIMTVPIKKTGNEVYDNGYLVGTWAVFIFLLIATILLFLFGLKLVKKKRDNGSSIHEIGNEN